MSYGYGYRGGPLAWLWCFVWVDLLTRVYGPWASCMVISFFVFAALFALLVMTSDPTPDTASSTASSTAHQSHQSHQSHTSQSASFDAWWANVIVLVTFAIIFAIPVISYNRSSVDTDRTDRTDLTDSPDQPKQAQRPLLTLPEEELRV